MGDTRYVNSPEKYVNSQEEYDSIPDDFDGYIYVRGNIPRIMKTPPRAHVYLVNQACVGFIGGDAHISSIFDNSTVTSIRDNACVSHISDAAVVHAIRGKARIYCISGRAAITSVGESARIDSVSGSVIIDVVEGSASIDVLLGSAHIRRVGQDAVIRDMFGNTQIEELRDGARIKRVGGAAIVALKGNSIIEHAYSSAVIRVYSTAAKIKNAYQNVVILGYGCSPAINECASSVSVIDIPPSEVSPRDFRDIFDLVRQPDGRIVLFKITQPDGTDYFSGQVLYEGIVECSDWDPDPGIQCGQGLHLSATSALAALYHCSGRVKRCLVDPEDIVFFKDDLSKVRCKKVEVIEDCGLLT